MERGKEVELREGYGRKKFFRDGFGKRTEDRKEIDEEWKELKHRIIGILDKMEGIREKDKKMGW